MQRDRPLMAGQIKSDAGSSPSSFFSFGKGQQETNTTFQGDLEMNSAPKGSVSHTFSNYFATNDNSQQAAKAPSTKERKVPTKIEPKVFFSNERTFLSWLNMAVTLSTISLAVVAFADTNKMSQIYGVMLLPVSISFIAYALYSYMRRAIMIRNKEPGPYEDRRGPVVLACMLAVAVIINFIVKIVEVMN